MLHHPFDEPIGLLLTEPKGPLSQRAALFEDRLQLLEGRLVFELQEDARVDRVAPHQGLLARALPVAGVVSFLVQGFDARLEEREVVVVIPRGARAEDVDEGEALVLNRTLNELSQMLWVPL